LALEDQIEPLLLELGAFTGKSKSLLEWANKTTVNKRPRYPLQLCTGEAIEGLTPLDHPYRMVALAIDLFLAEPHGKIKTQAPGLASVKGSRGKTCDLILSGLNRHHGYDGTSILNAEPIGVNELAEQISKQRAKDGQKPIRGATVSKWFGKKFGGHDKYKIECTSGNLSRSLKLLNGDFTPRMVSQAVAESAE